MAITRNFRDTCSSLAVILVVMGALSATARANQTQTNFNLAAGATSAPIPVPGINTPVSMTCASNTPGYRGIGQATLLRPSPNAFLEWVGTDIATGSTSSGYSGTKGTHVIYCSYTDLYVEIQIYSDSQIQVVNHSTITATGVINWVW